MHLRPLVPLGLALVASTGCQSYFPYGYGNSNPYPPMSDSYSSSGATTPTRSSSSGASSAGSRQFPTPANSQINRDSGSNRATSNGSSAKGKVPDPRYAAPGTPPTNLGASDEDDDSIRGGSSSLEGRGPRSGEADDDSEQAFASLGEEKFEPPARFRPASASSDDPDVRRPLSRPAPSPYKKDPNGYSWLRGVVSHDAKSGSWRITYSRDPLDNDPYQGSLTLVNDRILDTLMDDDVVYVEGAVDRSATDRYGKPSYRATSVTPLQPKDN